MGDNFTIVSRHQTTELVGTTDTRDVVRVGVTTKPSGIYFEFDQPLGTTMNASIAARAHTYSDDLESIAASPQVAAVQYTQDINAAGQITDDLTIYVEATTDEGEADGQIVQPFSNLDAADIAPKITALYKSLLATLNL